MTENDKLLQSLHTGKKFATKYAAYRPSYPQEVYDHIMSYHLERHDSLPCDQQLAVDVCCGSGQSTLPLTKYFGKVVGSDVSVDLISKVPAAQNLTTAVAAAEDLRFLESGTVDLVTIATSLQWVNLDKFFSEVRRVLKPDGTFAAYSYWFDQLDNVEADTYLKHMRNKVFGKYLTSRMDIMKNKYTTIKLPFRQIQRFDNIEMTANMTLKEYMGYIESFHYINFYLREFPDSQILEEMETSLASILGGGASVGSGDIQLSTKWNVFMVLGRNG